MRFKNLLVLLSIHDPVTSLKSSIAIAKDMRARLDVLVLNETLPVGFMASMEYPNYGWHESITAQIDETKKRGLEIQSWLKDKHVDATVTSSCQQLGLIDDAVSEPALYADLVLYHRCELSLVSGIMSKGLEGALFDAGKPALVLTDRSELTGSVFKSVAIAWDPVPQAMKALTASLPFLKRALNVSVFIATGESRPKESESQSPPILDWLRNHEVEATLEYVPIGKRSISETLIDHINNLDTDLIVMGAYGHTRLSERMFSGVSHTVLAQSNKSLFLAH